MVIEMGSNVLLYLGLNFSNLKHHILKIISVPKAERPDHVKDFGTHSGLLTLAPKIVTLQTGAQI